MDEKEAFVAASRLFGSYVAAVRKDQWNAPTPDTEWGVRKLVNHVTGEELWVPEIMAGQTVAEVGDKYDGDVLGNDPGGAWEKAARAAEAAVGGLAELGQVVHLSFADVPAREYLHQLVIDRVIHGWDLARAIGAPEQIDEALVKTAYRWLLPQADSWRGAGIFGPEVAVPDNADSLTKLLALSGRRA